MEVTNQATSEKKTSMAELFQYCIENGSITVEAVHLLMQECLEKDKQIAELTQRIENLENKILKKAGRKKQLFMLDGKELTDEYLIYLVDCEYYDNINQLEKAVGAGKNQLRNRYKKAKEKQQLEKAGEPLWKSLDLSCRTALSPHNTLLHPKLSKTACKKC